MQTDTWTVTFKCEGCGVRKPEAERYRPRSAFTVCSQACLDTAAQKKAQTLHAPHRRQTPPRHPCYQWELKPTGFSEGYKNLIPEKTIFTPC